MLNLIIAPEAERDLVDIWQYIAEDNITNANRYLDFINSKLEQLAEFPEIGTHRPELTNNVRSFPIERYILFYRIKQNSLEIVRILHSSRDIKLSF
jgi:toxin ParE1/3/4